MIRIGYLGAGCWGYCLARILASKGHQVTSWTTKADLCEILNNSNSAGQKHPFLPRTHLKGTVKVTTNLEEALNHADILVESVTSAGLRPVLEKVKAHSPIRCPLVITSKGIEQNTGLILPEVAIQVLGEGYREFVGVLSGPGYAEEVIQGLPTSVVASAFDPDIMRMVCDAFTTDTFRVYPNSDIRGVSYGGSLKNIIAIACGISEGLSLGSSAKAALITRGLHEIRKLAVANGCLAATLNGLSGMGDLCMTCSSSISRNFRFGLLLAKGLSVAEAQSEIKTVVEGAYTCVSALQLSKQLAIPMPITEMVYKILYENLQPLDAVKLLMQRPIKEEHE
jgi:glycerol-3-phosphate dehydrogenase (NAD(P)+)